ncbi:carbohydrate sulfotransferase 10-like [Argopecten irradians]|uniref:carbohydrate sulfotransferase 10-like n=1 Tax=Argopecten irradians TaxID=31199 RepID=UPI003712A2C9
MILRRWKGKVAFIFVGTFLLYMYIQWMKHFETIGTYQRYAKAADEPQVSNVRKGEEEHLKRPDVSDVNKERRERINRVCSTKENELRRNKPRIDVSQHIHIDEKHKLTYCYLFKAGFTFWGILFKIIRGDFNVTSPFDPTIFYQRGIPIDSLHDLPESKRASFFDSSFSFMFTRDPYSRLLSGYSDKLFRPNFQWRNVAPTIAKRVRNHNHNQTCVSDIQFSEFIKYVIHSEEQRVSRNPHYSFAFDFCDPCKYKYDFIGKMETIKHDTLHLLDKMKQPKLIAQIENNFRNQFRYFTIKERMDTLSSCQREEGLLCTKSFSHILKKLWKGFQMDGIISKKSKYPIPEKQSDMITPTAFHDIVVQAIGDAKDETVSRKNKEEAMLEAYSTVDTADMEKLSKLLQPDCEVFGYDCRPDKLFKDRKYIKPWYFDISTA